MLIEEMEQRLDILYSNVLNKDALKTQFNEKELSLLSAPFLLKVPLSYVNEEKRILYIGKETNIWWGKLKHFVDIESSIDILKQRYEASFYGGDVKRSRNIDETKRYIARDWGNSAFFSKYCFFENEVESSSVLWTSLLKMDSGEKTYSKSSIDDIRVKKLSKEILKNEIAILKPHVIVFVTATSTNLKKYDDAIKETLNHEYINSKVIESKKFWIFEYNGVKCYRTLHPLSYQYQDKSVKYDYYKDIADDINNGFKLFE